MRIAVKPAMTFLDSQILACRFEALLQQLINYHLMGCILVTFKSKRFSQMQHHALKNYLTRVIITTVFCIAVYVRVQYMTD